MIPFPTPFNKEDRSLQAQGLTSALKHQHHVASVRSRAHTKSGEAAGDRGERAGKASAARRREKGRLSLILQPSPQGSEHKWDGEAEQIRRRQPNTSLAV